MPNHITPPDNCTGCGLCANVCSKDAIRMVWSNEGFLVPLVDSEKCVNCGLCVKQCIALEGRHEYTDDINSVIAYGGWHKDAEIHLNSSSGGIFTALAENVIQQGGVVFGVVWRDKVTAVFDKAETVDELSRMRGSKYTPAVPGKVYRDVRSELNTGRTVLFSGTPCQVHALKKYLRKPYENLLTFDIVCHGVPSRKLLQAYVKHYEQEQGKKLKEIYFRFKDGNWQGYKVQKRFVDGSVLNHPNGQDMFMRLFIGDKMLNKCCYNCPHAHLPRPGDLTLGDYWGDLQSLHPDWPIKDGIGSLVANSEKGQTVLESLAKEGKISLHREAFLNLYNGQPRSYLREQGHDIPKAREAALSALENYPLEKVYDLFCNKTKIGPFHIRTNGLLYKIIVFPRRVAGCVKRKIISRS